MIEKFLKFLSGYVCISIEGAQLERFLNLCRNRKISMEKIHYTDEKKITAVISLRDFFKLRQIRSKSKVHIRVLNKQGMPFFFYRNKKRKAFFLGILLSFLIMLFLSGRIWNIHIEGNIKNTTPEILEFLEKGGISHGMAKNHINCVEIAAAVRRKYPEITWVSARIEGTRLIVTVQEGIMQKSAEKEKPPCNLTAEEEGEIVKMITRKGIPLMKPGDTCKTGDLLVSGELSVMNDSQEVVRYEYVHADADVYIRHNLAYYYEFPLSYKKELATDKIKKGFFLNFGRFHMGFYPKTDKKWRQYVNEYPLRITENFILPLSFGTVVSTEYETLPAVYTEEEAKKLAYKQLHLYEEKLLQKGIQISENKITVKMTDTACISKGYLTVIEKTGRESPLTKQEQPIRNVSTDF